MRVKAGLEYVVANPATIHKSKEKGTVKDKFQEFQNILCNCQVLNSLHTIKQQIKNCYITFTQVSLSLIKSFSLFVSFLWLKWIVRLSLHVICLKCKPFTLCIAR